MDNLCHTLVGAAAAEAGLKRHTRFGTLALLVSANLPDVDVLVFATSTPSIVFRRGWTHGILAQLALPALLAAVLWAIDRRRADLGSGRARFVPLFLLSLAGVYSHVFLDYLNNYGVRLLAPFDWRWFYGDAVFIVDPFLWVTLGAGVWLARRWRATRPAGVALLVATAYIAAMLIGAGVSRGSVEAQWTAAHGRAPAALMVGPRLLSPLSKDVIVDDGSRYDRGRFTLPSTMALDQPAIPTNAERPEVAAARASPAIRDFLVWSRFPLYTLEPADGGTRVTVTDARFMERGFFAASVVVPAARGSDPSSRAVERVTPLASGR